jgi:transposase
MLSSKTYFGVDVSKATLDFHGPGVQGSLPNDPAGQRRLLARLPQQAHLVCEASGGYERALVAVAHKAGVTVSVVNPRQVRDFARGRGRLAKTDAIDAAMLAQFGQAVAPKADPVPSPAQVILVELVTTRQQLVAQRTVVLQQSAGHALKLTRSLARARLKLLDGQIKKLAAAISAALQQEAALGQKAARLVQADGIGALTAATCVALCPELGTLSKREVAALVGVAPFNDDSGPRQGQRHIAGGRARLRSALYMAALTAIRHNPILHRFYQQLRRRHKPAKVALTAVIRKLAILLNHLLKNPSFQLAN